ncbi:MAG: hypothetical protein AAFQ80_01755 [Cyanobacteria bacterium J06621_8]
MTQQSDNNQDELKILLELYKIVVEEYRFQTNLNWDRSKFYVLLNSALITTSSGLLRLPGFKFAEFLTAPLYILGLLAAWLGYQTLIKGIEYRRRVVFKKNQFENKLIQYSDLVPIDTTAGMREVRKSMEEEEFVNRPPRIGTISYFLASLFILLMVINGLALSYLVYKEIFDRIP